MTVPEAPPPAVQPPAAPGRSARSRILSGSVLVAAGLAVAQLLSYGMNVVAARTLPPDQFGALGALLGLILIAGVVALALQTVGARRLAVTEPGQRRAAGWTVMRLATRGALLVGAVVALLSPLLDRIFSFGGIVTPLLVAVATVGMTAQGGQLGLAQGVQHYGRLASLYGFATSMRSAGGIAGALIAGTLVGTMAAYAVGALVGWGLGHFLVAALESHEHAAVPGFVNEVAHVGHALLAFFVLTNMDVLLARAFLPPAESGDYAVGVLMAKVAFFLPQFVTVVAFPRMARAADARPVLLATAATGTIGLFVTVVAASLSTTVVRVLGGASYLHVAPLIWAFAALGSIYAVVQVLLYGRIAVSDRTAVAALWSAAGVLLVVVGLWRHATAGQIVSTALAVATALVAVGLVVTVRHQRSS